MNKFAATVLTMAVGTALGVILVNVVSRWYAKYKSTATTTTSTTGNGNR